MNQKIHVKTETEGMRMELNENRVIWGESVARRSQTDSVGAERQRHVKTHASCPCCCGGRNQGFLQSIPK